MKRILLSLISASLLLGAAACDDEGENLPPIDIVSSNGYSAETLSSDLENPEEVCTELHQSLAREAVPYINASHEGSCTLFAVAFRNLAGEPGASPEETCLKTAESCIQNPPPQPSTDEEEASSCPWSLPTCDIPLGKIEACVQERFNHGLFLSGALGSPAEACATSDEEFNNDAYLQSVIAGLDHRGTECQAIRDQCPHFFAEEIYDLELPEGSKIFCDINYDATCVCKTPSEEACDPFTSEDCSCFNE